MRSTHHDGKPGQCRSFSAKIASLSLFLCVLAAPGPARAVKLRNPLVPPLAVQYGIDHGGHDYNCGGHFYSGHPGNDFPAPYGTQVVAAASGTVTYVVTGCDDVGCLGCTCGGSCGNHIIITHDDGSQTKYCHLSSASVAVSQGQQVTCGQPIALTASSGWTDGPHLHFEYAVDGVNTDPYAGDCSGGESAWVQQNGYNEPPSDQCDGPKCQPHCEGSVVVDANCGHGDCGVYGANCVDDALGVRCVFFACPAIGVFDVCLPDNKTIGHCENGGFSNPGDCSQYAAFCSTAGGKPAHCTSIFCASGPSVVPTPHEICFVDGDRASCDETGNVVENHCPAGEKCSIFPVVHCEKNTGCPATGDTRLCIKGLAARCINGGITEATDCSSQGAL